MYSTNKSNGQLNNKKRENNTRGAATSIANYCSGPLTPKK